MLAVGIFAKVISSFFARYICQGFDINTFRRTTFRLGSASTSTLELSTVVVTCLGFRSLDTFCSSTMTFFLKGFSSCLPHCLVTGLNLCSSSVYWLLFAFQSRCFFFYNSCLQTHGKCVFVQLYWKSDGSLTNNFGIYFYIELRNPFFVVLSPKISLSIILPLI